MDFLNLLFDEFLKMPFRYQALIIATLVVFEVPLRYLLSPIIYKNEPLAAHFFENFYLGNNLLLFAHICFAIPAILFGPVLFYAPLRAKRPDWHRFLGKIYVIGCLLSAVTVIPLALHNHGGPRAQLGFTVMGCLWFTITYFAYTAAIHQDFVAHRRWMLRSYAMTLAFIHVNLTYKYFMLYDVLSAEGAKIFQSMVSWMFNLFIVEFYLAATKHSGKFKGFGNWGKDLAKFYNHADRFYLRPLNKTAAKNNV